MTIDITGPDNSTFQFPDDTPPATISAEMAKQYGAPEAAPTYDHSDPALQDQSLRAALRGVPGLGAYVTPIAARLRTFNKGTYPENVASEEAAKEEYEKKHPIQNLANQALGGTIAFGGAGAIPGVARVLGMAGPVWGAARNAALSGFGIGAIDAKARGEDVTKGAIQGAISGPAGVLIGKGMGHAFDTAGRLIRNEPAVPTRFMDVNGTQVPIRESVVTRNPDTARTEQSYLKEGQPAAMAGEEGTATGMQRAHEDVAQRINPGGPATASPLEAADAVSNDLVSQEQQRAAAEVARGQAAAAAGQQIRDEVGPQARPLAVEPSTVPGQSISEGVQNVFQRARAATQAAYNRVAQAPVEFNPRFMLNAGENIRLGLNSGPDPVRINPKVTPRAADALQVIDDEISQLRFTNDAARGQRPITAADMEQVRKPLVGLRRQANATARIDNNWEDVRAVGRVISGFDQWLDTTARRPGGLISGSADNYIGLRNSARFAHSQQRSMFSRQGPGDKVGRFMENVIGKYPGQEMQPDDIMKNLLGSPTNPGGADYAIPALERLRNVLGERSPEWQAFRRAAVQHFTEPVPGQPPLAPTEQADRILRFLGNDRHAGAVLDQGMQARLAAHANQLRGVEDQMPMRGTPAQKIAVMSGRITGEPWSGAQIVQALINPNNKDAPALAREIRANVSPESWGLIKAGLFKLVSEAPEGMTKWSSTQIHKSIAKFLNTDLARTVYDPNDLMLMKGLADAHQKLIPIEGSTNPSGTAHMIKKLASGLGRQLLAAFGFTHGGLPGVGAMLALGKGLEWTMDMRAANQATRLFFGPQAGAESRAPQAIGAIAGQLPAFQLARESR